LATAEAAKKFFEAVGEVKQVKGLKTYAFRQRLPVNRAIVMSNPTRTINGVVFMTLYAVREPDELQGILLDKNRATQWRLATAEEAEVFERELNGEKRWAEINIPEKISGLDVHIIARLPKE